MAAPTSITYRHQRLIQTDAHGITRRYRIVITNHDTKIFLDKPAERKAAQAVLNILTQANLNQQDTDLKQVKLKGRVVEYKNKKVTEAKRETYLALSEVITNASPKKTTPITSPSPSPQLPVFVDEEQPATNNISPPSLPEVNFVHVKNKPKSSVLAPVFEKFRSSPKKLQDILKELVLVETHQGKLRVFRDGVKFSPSEVGQNGRKGISQKSENAVSFVLNRVILVLEASPSENDISFAVEILKLLKRNSWSTTVLKKSKVLRDLLGDAVEALKNAKPKDEAKFLDSEQLIASVLTNPVARSNFLIGYRAVLDGKSFFDAEKLEIANEIKPQVLAQQIEIGKTLEMLEMLNSHIEKHVKGKDELRLIPFYKNVLDFLKEWVSDDTVSNKEYFHRDVNGAIKDILALVPSLLDGSKRQIMSAMDNNHDIARVENPYPQPKETTLSWQDEATAVKQGLVKGEYYQELVRAFAADISNLHIFYLKSLSAHDMNSKERRDDNLYTDFRNKMSHFVASDVLAPVNNDFNKQFSVNMYKFFMDVQKELIKDEKLDAALTIRTALQQTPISRLKLLGKLPGTYTTFQDNLDRLSNYSGTGNEYSSFAGKANRQNLIPSYDAFRHDLDFAEEILERKEWGRYNIEMIEKSTESKRPILEAQKNLKATPINIHEFLDQINDVKIIPKVLWDNSYRVSPT